MVQVVDHGVFLTSDGAFAEGRDGLDGAHCARNTMAFQIMDAHDRGEGDGLLKLKFDALVSPDNNYVSILQTAIASGIERFPVPYVLSNCHNTQCTSGGTMNADDHVFGLDCARRYGGIFVPPYRSVLHQYMRERMARCGAMILGSDSHTRYGALGTMGVGEGGGELVKQLLGRTYDLRSPSVVAVRLSGTPRPGVGPQDVALAIIGAVYQSGFLKNKVLEFVGPGLFGLSVEYRMGIDVMMTESGAYSSIWCTDGKVHEFLAACGREGDYRELRPSDPAYYDGMVDVDLGAIECMMALPFSPGNVVPIHEFTADPQPYLERIQREGQALKGADAEPFDIMGCLRGGRVHVDQALVSGCCGGLFENIAAAADVLSTGDAAHHGITAAADAPMLGIHPASQTIMAKLSQTGVLPRLLAAGAFVSPCSCGPCFGSTDTPANNQLSVRHVTRNFPNREGSKTNAGQMAGVILMDARSIAATVANGGYLTAATDLDVPYAEYDPNYGDCRALDQVDDGKGKPERVLSVRRGPSIRDWPDFAPPARHLLLTVAGSYEDPVGTDDLSPSGEASTYRSNPERLATFTMINRDPSYLERARAASAGDAFELQERASEKLGCIPDDIGVGSLIAASKIGEGSSREQAASCQRILGGWANVAGEYATKRYRSNLINWGILPIVSERACDLAVGQHVLIRDVSSVIEGAGTPFTVEVLETGEQLPVRIDELTVEEREILSCGCLINYNRR